ncbi:GM19226 [Drosophila sechellia]|uniref:GM19226 n=1 Tax=Drosophila sechellia TaxID=7238 RepID=B4I9V5_DROSE|nr:GM19226 [Drosophila sechellia]
MERHLADRFVLDNLMQLVRYAMRVSCNRRDVRNVYPLSTLSSDQKKVAHVICRGIPVPIAIPISLG